jgi:hypothetical protein
MSEVRALSEAVRAALDEHYDSCLLSHRDPAGLDELTSVVVRALIESGMLLVELAAREAGRREHKNWRKASAKGLIAVLDELGVKLVIPDAAYPETVLR